jgi:hypothetical protein
MKTAGNRRGNDTVALANLVGAQHRHQRQDHRECPIPNSRVDAAIVEIAARLLNLLTPPGCTGEQVLAVRLDELAPRHLSRLPAGPRPAARSHARTVVADTVTKAFQLPDNPWITPLRSLRAAAPGLESHVASGDDRPDTRTSTACVQLPSALEQQVDAARSNDAAHAGWIRNPSCSPARRTRSSRLRSSTPATPDRAVSAEAR